ncbi:calcium/calmodulin-dependent serine/threonine-protein kinase 1-like isoform X1 [Ananas comosus]|uniref:Calcium/calmodulin-dependent serine/threonine-protein kinase 1-like isoform X1 n=1 Tax=Ananas comosus TaxID=4615 RepID=A0A6P5GRD3_ANACO|nr:calcium/calmodulin-dependent serine/threonine-protein kinase 1-like isoform X1 [Ananas comosus]XP_020108494.1 calcium/calmodulin-dependent serine/threonine-protein kinase 1-like isoform X1 [Ananas comosus]
MGLCHGKPIQKTPETEEEAVVNHVEHPPTIEELPPPKPQTPKQPKFSFYIPSPLPASYKSSPANSSVSSTPLRLFKRPFPPPSPAKHIKALLARRHGSVKPNEASIPEGSEVELGLDKNFGFSKHFFSKYDLGEEVGRGHFGYTCSARAKKGELKGEEVAVKVIPKAKMTTAISIEDVRREVRILSSLSGHKNLVQFHDAYEDEDNVYIIMELCTGGELLDRILSRGGKYSEEDAKAVMVQILSIVSFCHLQGVVHRDLKPENFLFSSKDDNSTLKVIDFGLSDFVKPDERLNDIVGSAYYVAPEVLHRSYGTEADMWSIGVIVYILLCGSRPFWARTESGIFRAVLKAEPSFDEPPWPSLSAEAKDFVRRLLNKDYRKRMTASQALCHPWIREAQEVRIPLDILTYKLMRAYISSSSLRKSALRALAKTLTVNQLFYLREQFGLLGPNKSGFISLLNLKAALMKQATEAMKDSRVLDFVNTVSSLQYRKLDFEEFAASAVSVYQMEGLDTWEQHARSAYEYFEKDGNRPIMIEELASELGLSPSVPVHVVLQDWIRHNDGKLSFLGFVKLLHGISARSIPKA